MRQNGRKSWFSARKSGGQKSSENDCDFQETQQFPILASAIKDKSHR
jgi:hypothetical protein